MFLEIVPTACLEVVGEVAASIVASVALATGPDRLQACGPVCGNGSAADAASPLASKRVTGQQQPGSSRTVQPWVQIKNDPAVGPDNSQ